MILTESTNQKVMYVSFGVRCFFLSIVVLIVSCQNVLAQLHGKQPSLKPVYGNVVPICSCKSLLNVSIANTTIISAETDPKDGACKITAMVNHPPANDSVKVWIALPVKNWNGRFEGTGGGGFLGGHPYFLEEPVLNGFAAGATNTGHDGGSGSFALDTVNHRLNWQLIRDNAYLGIHDMTIVGKELVKAFYGKPARYSYFFGGSMGGRQGIAEAIRYPNDYDGILSLFPAVNFTRFLVADMWPQAVMNEEKNYIPAEKLIAANKMIIGELDAIDGRRDSVIDDPFNHTFDPQTLVGKIIGGSNFTQADANVIKRIWEGPRTRDGKFLWYGFFPGADLTITAGTEGKPLAGKPFGAAADYLRFFLLMNTNWTGNSLTLDEFELLYHQSVEQYHQVYATDDPDLGQFKRQGGKLLILHGLTDQYIPPQGSIDYYNKIQDKMGGSKATMDFTRLFLLPGLDHSFQGFGAKPVNQFSSLIDWVEHGKAPEQIFAEFADKAGKILQKRTYTPYFTTPPKLK